MSVEPRAEDVRSLERFAIPYGKEVEHMEVVYENGFPMLRVRIKEGKRFTMIDLDPETADAWGRRMQEWARGRDQESVPEE